MLAAWMLFGLGFCAGCTTPAAPIGAEPVVTLPFIRRADVVYTPASWPQSLRADLYVPEGDGPFPAVVVAHGGGWVIGSRLETASICKRLARHGYIAMNVEYRLLPDFPFPAALQDLQQALRWMKTNASGYRIDPQRLGAWGYSAGAQLVSLLGTLSAGDAYYAGDVRVRAVISGGTPADLRPLAASSLVQDYLGGTLAQKPEHYREASPTALVSAGGAPTFLYAGAEDAIVPTRSTVELKAALDAAGVPNEVFWVPSRGHVTTFLFDDSSSVAAIRFLDRYLKPPAS